MPMQDVKYKETISKCLNDLKVDNCVLWSDFVVAFKNEIIEDCNMNHSTYNKRNFKGNWVKRTKVVAQESDITLDMKNDNWQVIEEILQEKKRDEGRVSDSSNISETSSKTGSDSSKKTLLGYKLDSNEKEEIQKMYSGLEKTKMWKLSSNRYVEEVMEQFTQRLNCEHPSCSLILDINDDHWTGYFSPEELREIKEVTTPTDSKLPENMTNFINTIPKTTKLKEIFLHLNSQIIDPYQDRDVYWLKNTLQQAADLFETGYIPLTNQTERDLIRRVWGFIDTAYDSSELTFRSEKASVSCLLESNKRRKIAATNPMDRQRTGDIPDMLIFFDRYEFGTAEVSKTETDTTKELNEGSMKLPKIMKSMLLNLVKSNSQPQHVIKIVGMFFSGLKVNFFELYNPAGYVCTIRRTKELYFPVHPKEFMKKMKPLVEQVWINKMDMESRLEIIMISDSDSERESYVLPSCFQRRR
ncbi:hypothetical protein EDC94DRAFT_236636 [Helicostylum pulchrum]|nr:hypothetical protein EDC94DRAFT_236636 [Helicostylum pulchrum]